MSPKALARACSLHPKRTLLAWAVALVLAIGAVATSLGDVLTTEGEVTNNPESEQGYTEIARYFPPSGDYVNELVVVRSASLTVNDSGFRGAGRKAG